jgi:uncharacterized membrane protein
MLQTRTIVAPSKGRVSLATLLFLGWMTVWSGFAYAQRTPPAPAPQPLAENAVEVLPKTITYGVMGALIDVGVGTIITGDLVTGTAMAVVGSTSSWLLYQVHEMAWAQLGPADQSVSTKTATFTVANVLRLFGVGMAFTGDIVLSGTFVVLDGIAESGAYVVTDRIWKYVVEPMVGKSPSTAGGA